MFKNYNIWQWDDLSVRWFCCCQWNICWWNDCWSNYCELYKSRQEGGILGYLQNIWEISILPENSAFFMFNPVKLRNCWNLLELIFENVVVSVSSYHIIINKIYFLHNVIRKRKLRDFSAKAIQKILEIEN